MVAVWEALKEIDVFGKGERLQDRVDVVLAPMPNEGVKHLLDFC